MFKRATLASVLRSAMTPDVALIWYLEQTRATSRVTADLSTNTSTPVRQQCIEVHEAQQPKVQSCGHFLSYGHFLSCGSSTGNIRLPKPFYHSFIHSSIHPSIHPFIHSFIHSFIRPLTHSFLPSFIHTFIDALTPSNTFVVPGTGA